MDRFAPCTTSGVTASHEQVCRVLALHGRPPVIALDGDEAGVEGTGRWLSGLCLDGGRPALVTTLPAGTDPAEWLYQSAEVQVCRPSTVARMDRRTWHPPGVEGTGRFFSVFGSSKNQSM